MKMRNFYWPAACIVAAFLLFASSLQVGFLSDDFHMLSLSASQDLSLVQYFTTNLEGTNLGSSYGPVFRLWWKGMYELFGNNPLPYHVFIVLLHGIAAYLVGTLVWILANKKDLAIASAILFLLLQSRAEPVMWIASFPHVFATVTVLSSIIAWQRMLCTGKKKFYTLAICSWLLALFTKEIAITVPVIWLLLVFVEKNSWREKILKALKFTTLPVGIGILYLLLRSHATGQLAGYYANAAGVPLGTMIQTSFDVLIGMWLPVDVRRVVTHWLMAHPVAVLLALGALVLYLKQTMQKHTAIFFAMAIIALVPFTQVLLHPFTQEGERYTYLVSAFVVPAVVLSLAQLFQKRRQFVIVTLAIVITQLYWLLPKQQAWVQASNKTEQIISSVKNLSLQDKDHIVLIGLPDNYLGAQMLRNAAGTALGIPAQERIPQYIEYRASTPIATSLNADSDLLILTSEQISPVTGFSIPVVTGFPMWQGAYTSSFIGSFTKLGNRGSTIEILLDRAKISEDITSNVQDFVILYVDNLSLKELVRLPSVE